jgi:hypothetical protein
MPDNPYLVPSDLDDDIFNPEAVDTNTKHTYDGTPCSECGGTIHQVSVDKDLPAEVREELDRIIDSLPDADKGARVIVTAPESPATQILKDIQDFFVAFDNSIAVGPALRVCIELLDQMTDNHASSLIELYTKEQQMIVYQDQARTLESMLGRIDEWLNKDESHPLITLKEILSEIRENLLEKLSRITEEYIEICNKAERNPRQDLLEARLDGDPQDIKFKLMFYHITSSLARDYIHKRQQEEEERTQNSVSTD